MYCWVTYPVNLGVLPDNRDSQALTLMTSRERATGRRRRVESCDDEVMGPLDVFTFIVLAVLLGVGIFAAFRLGALPGQIAARRGHPQADAIRVAGWVGLVTLGLLWPLYLG